jgi:hypothetical protein
MDSLNRPAESDRPFAQRALPPRAFAFLDDILQTECSKPFYRSLVTERWRISGTLDASTSLSRASA